MSDNSVKAGLIGIVATLVGSLLLGSYLYTWSADGKQEEEKKQWRSEHNRVLEKNFDDVKENQKNIEKVVTENQKDVQKTLQEILLEQRRKSK